MTFNQIKSLLLVPAKLPEAIRRSIGLKPCFN